MEASNRLEIRSGFSAAAVCSRRSRSSLCRVAVVREISPATEGLERNRGAPEPEQEGEQRDRT
jgi:hypothetical protein